MFREQHNQRWEVNRQPHDDLYHGWELMPIPTGWGFDARCGYCYLGHAHTWQMHDDSIMNTAVQDVETTLALKLEVIPESRQAEYITAVYCHLARRIHDTRRDTAYYGTQRHVGRFNNYLGYESILQGWEHLQAWIEIKYPSCAI
jgi:hypothetical protein